MMYTNISPNKSSRNGCAVDRLTIHCMAGHMTAKACCDYFAKSSTQASANYCIGSDGEVAVSVDPKDRSWCSSNGDNDRRAITIEVSSDNKHPYIFDSKALDTLMEFVPNVMKMYNKDKLVYLPDKDKALAYQPKPNEMLLTFHRWFKNKACPGDWWMGMQDAFVNEINKKFSNQNQTNDNQPIQDTNNSDKEKIDKEILYSLKNKIDSLFKVYGIE